MVIGLRGTLLLDVTQVFFVLLATIIGVFCIFEYIYIGFRL